MTYETNHDLALALKKLPTLAIEKTEKIGDSYDIIVQEIQNVCEQNCLEPEKIKKNDKLCLYLGSTYIKSLAPNREVLFPFFLDLSKAFMISDEMKILKKKKTKPR